MPLYSKAALAVLALFATVLLGAHACAARTLDGATIVNSGSTNTVGWRIAVRSDGNGTINGRAFSVSPATAQRLFRDAENARDANIAAHPCVKSASFGTRLNVYWHGWTSPDLSCPPLSPAAARLRRDVSGIEHAAAPPTGLRRFHVPVDLHRTPPTPHARPFAEGGIAGAPKSGRL